MLPDTLYPGAAFKAALGQLLGFFRLNLAPKYRRQVQAAAPAPPPPELPTSSSVPLTRPEEAPRHDAAAGLAPAVAVISQIPVAGPILAAPLKVGAAIADALGYDSRGSVNNFDPWQRPDDADFARKLVLNILDQRAHQWDPATQRFLNPDGSLAFVGKSNSLSTDASGRVVDWGLDSLEIWNLWVKKHLAAVSLNYDRSKVEADGFTLKPPAAPTSPSATRTISWAGMTLTLPAPAPAAAAPPPASTTPAPAPAPTQVASQALSLFASARAVAFPRMLEP